jgi:hypothetical protein
MAGIRLELYHEEGGLYWFRFRQSFGRLYDFHSRISNMYDFYSSIGNMSQLDMESVLNEAVDQVIRRHALSRARDHMQLGIGELGPSGRLTYGWISTPWDVIRRISVRQLLRSLENKPSSFILNLSNARFTIRF